MGSQVSGKVLVNKERYLEIIGFTAYVYLTDRITKYSGMAGGRVRTLGEFMENFIYGKIAEEAFSQFLKSKLGICTLTEVGLADFCQGLYLPDIVVLRKNNGFVPMEFWIDVKEVRRDQKWLLVPASSISGRPYDAYVAVRVGLPQDHVAWMIGNLQEVRERMDQDWIDKVRKLEAEISEIQCEVLGFALWNDVQEVLAGAQRKSTNNLGGRDPTITANGGFYFDGNTKLFDPNDTAWKGAKVGKNVGFYLRSLKTHSKWSKLAKLVTDNKKIIPSVPLPKTKSGKVSRRTGLPEKYNCWSDYRSASQDYLKSQLGEISARWGSIERSKSWFSQCLR